jgi:type IV fimbrial biogenesis protein FimT
MTATDYQPGFTLIELLVVIAIASILATIAAPTFVDLTKNSRLNSAASELQNAIQLARTEAISRNTIVNLYNTNENGDWSDDIYLCEATSATSICESNKNKFIKKITIGDLTNDNISNGNITIDSNDIGNKIISVNANGRLNTTEVKLALCDSRTTGNRDYQLLTIAVTGRPSVTDLGAAGTCLQ